MVIEMPQPFGERLRWRAIGSGLRALAAALKFAGRRDPWLGRALAQFQGVYRFENADGSLFQYLVFSGRGQVQALRDFYGAAHFTFTIYKPHELARASREGVLAVVIGNKIGQTGNLYYLYQFGFVMSLLDQWVRRWRKA